MRHDMIEKWERRRECRACVFRRLGERQWLESGSSMQETKGTRTKDDRARKWATFAWRTHTNENGEERATAAWLQRNQARDIL